jgi:cysteine-rich repeat protein
MNSSCGNGKKGPNEECDDGNNDSGDGCTNDCRIEPNYYCGINCTSGISLCG